MSLYTFSSFFSTLSLFSYYALASLLALCSLMLTYATQALLQYEAKYLLCLNHLIIVITVLEFYSFLISFFLRITFTMLFFLILRMKLSYFVSWLRIFSVLSTLYHKCSFFFMFKVFHKSLNFHLQLILIIVDSSSFCRAIMSSYSLLCNVICDWSLICDVEWDFWLRICFLLTWTSSVDDSFSVFDLINLFYITSVIEDLIMSCNIYNSIW
jgi:hypothetical protein